MALNISSATLWVIFIVAGMLLTGTINTVVKKVQNGWMANGTLGYPHKYNAPWQQTFWMFAGEMLCWIGLFAERWRARAKRRQADAMIALNSDEKDEKQESAPEIFSWLFVLPTICDLTSTAITGIGLLYIPAAAWQMLRGSTIIFSGILSVIFLKKKLTIIQTAGMLVVVSGLVCVGATVLLPDEKKASSSEAVDMKYFALGVILTLAGQLITSVQMVVEEIFLKQKNFSAFHVVSMEGTIGAFLMGFFVLPLVYFLPGENGGSYENVIDALYQIGQSAGLLGLIIGYVLSIAFFNFFSLSVSKTLTTIHRTLIDACRTIFVWASTMILYYAGTGFGEGWGKWSFLQLIGFALLIIGTMLYNGTYKTLGKFIKEKILKKKEAPEVERESLLVTPSMQGGAYQQLVDVADEH